jgi:hypothetical protein
VKRAVATLGAVLTLSAGCRHAASTEASPSSAPSASARPSASLAASIGNVVDLAPLVTSDVQAPGLRVQSGTLGAAARWGFSNLALDRDRTKLEVRLAPGGANLDTLVVPGALAAVNGGYFEADFRPSTWVVAGGVELAPKSDTSKGGVLALGPGGLYVGPVSGLGFAPVLAVQSFPLVVEAEGKAGIYRDDGRRAARTIACLVDDTLRFIVIAAPRGDGPTLFETAALLRQPSPVGFGCRRALNLDGGPSSGVWFGPAVPAKPRPPFAKVGYALVILPR